MSGLIRQANRPIPTRYDYVINEQYVDRSKYFGSDITLNDILLSKGPDAKDYTDISAMARRHFAETTDSLSDEMNPLYDKIAASGGIMDIDHDFVRWKNFGKPERELRSLGSPNLVIPKCGLGGRGPAGAPMRFKVRFDSPFLKAGNLLAPNINKSCQIKIVSDCVPAAGGYEYEAETLLNEPFPVEFLKSGLAWIRMGALTGVNESGEAGGFEFTTGFSYIEFEVPLTTMQWEYSVTESAWRASKFYKVGKCASGDQSADPFAGGMNLTSFLEEQMKANIRRECEYFMVYGRSTRQQVDTVTQDQEMTSPGLLEYMEQAQNIYYSPGVNGLDKMMAELKALWFDKVPISKRNITLYTGEAGLEQFSCWVERKFGKTAVISHEDSVLKTSTPYEAGRVAKALMPYQFTKYYFPSFGSISVKHWSLLDNTRVNGVKFPGDYRPVSSYEYWAFDEGMGSSNIKLLRNRTKERSIYYPGTIGPNGYVGPGNPIYKNPSLTNFDGYKYKYRTSKGLVCMNPQKMVIIRPDICL